MTADGPDLYHGGISRPRFLLRHNSKIIGRLSCVTSRPLSAQITISDCRINLTYQSAWKSDLNGAEPQPAQRHARVPAEKEQSR